MYVAKGLLLRHWVAAVLVCTSVAFAGETTFEPSAIIDEYVAAIVAAGQSLTASLKNHDYGMREATVRDPDGNDIYIGQPL